MAVAHNIHLQRQAYYGGYSCEPAEKVPDKFLCSICTKLLREAQLTLCCGQHFCESCLDYWFKRLTRKSCPHCRKVNFEHVTNKERIREINELKIHCTHHREGCQWIGELGDLRTHLDSEGGCGYVEVECPNDCGDAMKRNDLNTHLNSCPQRIVACQYCHLEDTYVGMNDHYSRCPKFPLVCPNRCGAKMIHRENILKHCEKCPLELVECPFKEAGCTVMPFRKDRASHMVTNQQEHLLRLMGAFQQNKRKLEETEKGLSKTIKEIEETRSELVAMKEVIATDVKLLSTNNKSLALASIQSQLDMHLTAESPLTIRMINFSKHKESNDVWYSPSFYINDGYKLTFYVYANGIWEGEGTHVSLSLFLTRGEFSDEREWPYRHDNEAIVVKLLRQDALSYSLAHIARTHTNIAFASATFNCICSECPAFAIPEPGDNGMVELETVETFVNHDIVAQSILRYDSIVMEVSVSSHRH